MRAYPLIALRPLLCAGLLLLASCDALWGPFKEGNEQSCLKNPSLCSEAQICNQVTRVCEDRCQSSKQCTTSPDRPLCLNGACVPCDLISDMTMANSQCAGRGVMGSQICVRSGGNKGQCLGCDSAADCTNDSFVCNAKNVCAMEPCGKNGQCKSGVCDPYQMVSGEPGRCVPTADLLYVNNKNGGACMSGDGTTPDKGLCTLAEGVQRAPMMGKKGVRVIGSSKDYGSAAVGTAGMRFSSALTIYGPAGDGMANEAPKAQLGRNPGEIGVAVFTGNGADVAIDGFEVSGASDGIVCDGMGGALSVRRTQVLSCDNIGVNVTGCGLVLDRTLVSGNKKGALTLTGSNPYRLTNNIIAGNSAAAGAPIKISTNSSGVFQFNTIVNNRGGVGAPGGIDCSANPHSLQDSIFFGNTGAASQFFDACVLERVVVGMSAPMVTGAILMDPVFVAADDFRLKLDDAKNTACCIDKAAVRDVKTDFFGTKRPQGPNPDIGAHEVR